MSGPGVNAIYTNNIPFSSNNPSSDQPLMEQNTNSINTVLSVDHIAFNTSNGFGGYHNIIHLVPQTVTPGSVTGINQFWAQIPPSAIPNNTATQLFTRNGTGGLPQQMSGNLAATNGCAWCAGILFQWGLIPNSGSATTQPVDFPFVFPTACYNVTLQNLSLFNSVFRVLSVTQTGFTWVSTTTTNVIYWLAIGN